MAASSAAATSQRDDMKPFGNASPDSPPSKPAPVPERHHYSTPQPQQQQQQQPQSTVEATWLSSDNNTVQYCIKPPGQNHPIFITFPQQQPQHVQGTAGDNKTGMQTQILDGSIELLSAESLPSSYDVAHMQMFLNGCGRNGDMMPVGSYASGVMGHTEMDRTAAMDSDDEILHQLWNDIMESPPSRNIWPVWSKCQNVSIDWLNDWLIGRLFDWLIEKLMGVYAP